MRWLFALLIWAAPAAAVTCNDVNWAETDFTVCLVDTTQEDLRLFHSDENGNVFGQFSTLNDTLDGKLSFAMNAGMYHADRSPVGLFQQGGEVKSNIALRAGPGNFGLLPNGVFCIRPAGGALVMESNSYDPAMCRDATQSGPMLVIDGALHPRLLPNGTSRHIRNGVGTSTDESRAYFVISNEPVNFHLFARFFKDHLELEQALYFDGKVSRLYAPDLGRADIGFQVGPMVGVVR